MDFSESCIPGKIHLDNYNKKKIDFLYNSNELLLYKW